MIAHDLGHNAAPGAPQQEESDQGADCRACQGSKDAPGRKRLRPGQEQGNNPAGHPAQAGGQGNPEGAAPEKWVGDMHFPVHSLMYQGNSAEALPSQFPERFPGFILLCEKTNEGANIHYLVLCLTAFSERPAMVKDFT
jgi:hypothetical protein